MMIRGPKSNGSVAATLALALLGCGGGKATDLATAPSQPTPVANAPTQEELDRIKLLKEAQAREHDARKQRRDAMRALGTGTVTKKKQIGSGKQVKLELEFEFTNKSQKEMASAEGTLEIRDASDEVLKSLKVPFAGPIKPGASVTKSGKFPADPGKPGDVTLVKTALKDLKLNWVPLHYKFSDGTDEHGE